jgi:hypothetical protein
LAGVQTFQHINASLQFTLGHQISKTLQSLWVFQMAGWKIRLPCQIHDGAHDDKPLTNKAAKLMPITKARATPAHFSQAGSLWPMG